MSNLAGLTWLLVLLTSEPRAGAEVARAEPWGRVLSLMEQGTPDGNAERVGFLKSLGRDEMLLCARQACAEVTSLAGEMRDMPPADVAEIYVLTCLHYYFEKVDRDEGANILLGIVSDRAESGFLRRALISRMWNRDEPFDGEFQAYLKTEEPRLTGLLTGIVNDRKEQLFIRMAAMDCLGVRLGRQVNRIIRSDPHVRDVVKEKRKHSDHVVSTNVLVRSGEVSLAEETVRALKPIEARMRAYIEVLGAILGDEANEPEDLRKHARHRLEGCRRSAITALDNEVDRTLQRTGE